MQCSAGVSKATSVRKGSHVHSILSKAIVGALLLGSIAPAAAQQQPAYQEAGKVGDTASWRNDEFKADWGLGAIGAEYAYARGLTGTGVRLGIFDSGADLRHGDFAGKNHTSIRMADPGCMSETVLAGPDACFTTDGDRPSIDYLEYNEYDRMLVQMLIDFGYLNPRANEILESMAGFSYGTHGTHVAGTMLANRDGNGTHGVAFNSDLTTARLFSNSYSDVASLLSGIFGFDFGGTSLAIGPSSEAVVDMYDQMAAAGVRAINHSWGLSSEPRTAGEMDGLYNLEGVAEYFSMYANASLNHGVLQVFAAGNNYGDIAGIYATLPRYVEGLDKYWLSVVNINQTGGIDESSSTCGLSKDWCVAAPGTDITSTVVDGAIEGNPIYDEDGNVIGFEVTSETPEHGYGDLTGTSMASPHVTGALALLMERFPYLDNPQIRDVMLTTATDLGETGVDEIYGWGLIDLKKAIEGPGMLRVDTNVVMNQRAGGAQVWEGLAWDDWTNDIAGPGRLTKSGIGWLRLSGDNTFAGVDVAAGILELDGDNALSAAVDVNGGALILNGLLTDTDLNVNSGAAIVNGEQNGGATLVGTNGKLGGAGTLSTTRVEGTIGPGNSIGTLTINGDYTQAAGSFFDAEISAPSAADLLNVTGHAFLEGGTVRVVRKPGEYLLGQSYNILSAVGGVTGQFAGIDTTTISPFLKFNFNYAANRVDLDVARGMALVEAANSFNQRAVAGAVDGMAGSQQLVQVLTQLFPAQAVSAFDSLSGELHASTQSVLVDGNRHVRDAALARAQAGTGAFAATTDGEGQSTAWIEVLRSGGALHDDGNAGRVDYNGDTTLLGFDYRFGNGWRVGVLGGAGRADMDVRSRGSDGDFDTRELGVYVGQSWGGFGLRAGATYGQHDVTIDRVVAFPGLQDRTHADYDATSTQAFVEGGYRFAAGAWEVEPYAQVAQVRVSTDSFQESGAAAALAVQDADARVNLSTLGLRFNVNLKGAHQDQSWLSLRGGIGRRHADGDVVPASTVAWTAGTAFTVHGAPLAEDATLAEVGLGARLSQSSLLELGYSGQLADEARDHRVDARFSVRF